MELKRYLYLLLRWLWLIVLVSLAAGTTAFFVSRNQPRIYRATATLLVLDATLDPANQFAAVPSGNRLAESYAQRLKNREVLSEVIDNLGLDLSPDYLARIMSIQVVASTQLINLSVEYTDPALATALANEIPVVFAARNLTQQQARFANSKQSLERELASLTAEIEVTEGEVAAVLASTDTSPAEADQANERLLRLRETHSRLLQSYEDIRIAEAQSINNIIIDEYARQPTSAIRPQVLSTTLMALVVGALLAVGVALLVDYLDDTIKSPYDIEDATGLSPLGAIRRIRTTQPQDVLVVAMEPRSPAAEAFRQVRTNIQFTSLDRDLRTLVVSSAGAGEGKSTTAANLAVALAQTGKRVLLVDADMRRPTLHTLLGVDGKSGLSNMIASGRLDASLLQGTLIPNLLLLPAGRIPPNPAEFLGSERMKALVAWLREQADIVIFDSPPLLAVTDGAVLAQQVDALLFVACASQTRFPALEAAVRQIRALDAHIAGIIVNKVDVKGNHPYARYYYQTDYQPGGKRAAPSGWRKRLQGIGTSIFG